jgi:rod shape determining protein RodA
LPQKSNRMRLFLNNIDWVLFILTIATVIYGIFAIYSATRSLGTLTNVLIQSIALCLGLVLMVVLSVFDYEQFGYLAKYLYIACIILLILVLIPGIGTIRNGARSWIVLGPFLLQPSELVKIGFIITFAYHLQKVEENVNHPLTLVGLLLHFGFIVGLILLQPDAGSAMVFAFIFICMIFIAKLSYKYIIPAVAIAGAALPLIYFFALSTYQKLRIDVFLHPESHPQSGGYSVIQSKIAVGSGQLWGKGYLQGTQNQMGALTTKHTDFIFSTISEELGFIGALVVLLLLFAIIFYCIRIARRANTPFGKYICIGVAAMFLFHTFENVGMCIGVMPVTGIPLPFISYGGSSLITNMIAMGLVMNVSSRSRDTMFN